MNKCAVCGGRHPGNVRHHPNPLPWWRRERGTTNARRTSIAWCPGCRRDLNGDNDSFVADEILVRYTCATCGTNSVWDFDAPVPLYLGRWS